MMLTNPVFKQNDKDNNDDDEREAKMREMFKIFGVGLVVFFTLPFLLSSNEGQDRGDKTVSWTDFFHNMLMAGEVEKITVWPKDNIAAIQLRRDAVYKGQRVEGSRRFTLTLPSSSSEDLEAKIREAEAKMGIRPGDGVTIVYNTSQETLSNLIFLLFILGVVAFLFKLGSKAPASFNNAFKSMTKAQFTLVDPQIRTGKGVKFSDVAGLREAKIEVQEFVDYLKNPDKYKELGARPPKGAMLFGPPGCGKTMLAKAVANESNVPFLSMNGSEFIEMIGGLGAARVRSLFSEARRRAPSIIYIDEIDAIGRQRGSGRSSVGVGESEQTLNQLLVEMDGIASKEGVIMLASTNRSDVLDKALLRPGRFDRHIEIDFPTLIERKEILEQHMKGVVLDKDGSAFSERLATLTPGFSGADLANLINEAALHAARMNQDKVTQVNLEYGKDAHFDVKVTQPRLFSHFTAIERVIAGPEKKTRVLNPGERNIVAYHESGHAIVGWMLQHTDALLKVTILPRTSAALGFAQYTPMDKKLHSPEELLDRMCMALGGRVAEALTFNRITTGAQNDLEKVTKMAYAQVKHFGFNPVVGNVSFEEQENSVKPYSKKLHSTMDLEARKLIAQAYQRTEEVLKNHSQALETMAQALLQRETLNYSDVEQLLGPPPFGKKHLVSPAEFEKALQDHAKLGQSDKS